MSKKKRNRRRKPSVLGRLFNGLFGICLVIVLAFCLRTFVVQTAVIAGDAMSETYHAGDIVLVTKFDYLISKPQHGDVALCCAKDGKETFVKRVIGLPGDEIVISNGTLTINGEAAYEPYVTYASADNGTVVLGEDEYMVMGDNRAVSTDSREDTVGMLHSADFLGRVRLTIWPFSK